MKARLTFLWLAVAVCSLAALRPARAEQPAEVKPLAVLSLSGYGEWKADLDMIGPMVEQPQLSASLEGMLKLFTKNQGLAGLDKSRPWGAVLLVEGDRPTGYGFLPVKDLKAFLDALKPLVPEIKEVGDGVYEVKAPRHTVYLRQPGGAWVFVADQPQQLAHLPENPAPLLKGLSGRYDVALRLEMANATAQQREKLGEMIKKHAAQHMQPAPGEGDQVFALRQEVAKRAFNEFMGAVEEMASVTVGISLDHHVGKAVVEVALTAKEGTDLAAKLAEAGRLHSRLSGFAVPGAAMSARWTVPFCPPDANELSLAGEIVRNRMFQAIDEKVRSPEEAEVAKHLANSMLDVLGGVISSGHVDGGMALILRPDAATLVAGGFVADGKKVEEILAKAVEEARKRHPDVVEKVLKTDVDRYQGIRFHMLSIPLPDQAKENPKVVAMLGDTLEVVVGIGDKYVYFAEGKNALKTLESAIEASANKEWQTAAPLSVTVCLEPLAKAAAEVGREGEREKAAEAAEVMGAEPGGDCVTLSVVPIPRGVKLRVELEEDVLKLLLRIAKNRGR